VWSEDRARCRSAGIPEALVHRPKWRIGLELYDIARGNGLAFAWVTFDEGYGGKPGFLRGLITRGQRFVGEVPGSLLHPLLHRIFGIDFPISVIFGNVYGLIFLAFLLLGAFFSGLYPALVLSSFKPVAVLKGKIAASAKGLMLRKSLVFNPVR